MSLEATLDAAVDGEVSFTFRVTNAGTSTVELTFRSGKRGDVVVRERDSGEEVWRWSEGRMFTQALSRTTVQPGEQIEATYRWKNPLPGSYVATGTLEANHELQAETELTI